MTVNVWIAQTQAIRAEVASVKGGATAKDTIKGARAEQRAYAEVASKIADKVDGLFSAPTIKTKVMQLESLYLDSVDEIAVLEKGGATILGAWNWDGSQVEGYPPHADIGKYMPARYETDEKGDTVEIVDETPRDVVLTWGQGERQFA
jgi:hypothetical protein